MNFQIIRYKFVSYLALLVFVACSKDGGSKTSLKADLFTKPATTTTAADQQVVKVDDGKFNKNNIVSTTTTTVSTTTTVTTLPEIVISNSREVPDPVTSTSSTLKFTKIQKNPVVGSANSEISSLDPSKKIPKKNTIQKNYNESLVFLECLAKAYSLKIDEETNSIVFNDGTKMSFQNIENIKEENEDLAKMFEKSNDYGRYKYEPFFKKIYGNNRKEIETNVVNLNWFLKSNPRNNEIIKINSKYGADIAMANILNEVQQLNYSKAEMEKFVSPPLGDNLKSKFIPGTKLLSSHAFGIAVDMSINSFAYWKWDLDFPKNRKNNFDKKIVGIFEKFGFIWGGSWYHYDNNHFEFRPELMLCKGKYFKR